MPTSTTQFDIADFISHDYVEDKIMAYKYYNNIPLPKQMKNTYEKIVWFIYNDDGTIFDMGHYEEVETQDLSIGWTETLTKRYVDMIKREEQEEFKIDDDYAVAQTRRILAEAVLESIHDYSHVKT